MSDRDHLVGSGQHHGRISDQQATRIRSLLPSHRRHSSGAALGSDGDLGIPCIPADWRQGHR